MILYACIKRLAWPSKVYVMHGWEIFPSILSLSLVKTTEHVHFTYTVEPLYNGHVGTSHFWVIFAVI